MINSRYSEFLDKLYYGEEIVFVYQGKKYFIQGYYSADLSVATMELAEVTGKPFESFLWEHHARNLQECAKVFLNAQIWDGKSFAQIQRYVIWSDW